MITKKPIGKKRPIPLPNPKKGPFKKHGDELAPPPPPPRPARHKGR